MMSVLTRKRGFRDDEGASALEFGIVAPVLLLLLFGMLEFGLMFEGQLAVTHAAREGARMAAVAGGANYDAGVVEQRAFPLTTADGLSISLSNPDADSVSVTVSYPWTWRIVPLGALGSWGSPPTLTSTATMRQE